MKWQAGIIGNPVEHSLSPKLHNFWLKQYQIEGSYIKIRADLDKLPLILAELIQKKFCGVNITIPYKEVILDLIDDLSEEARLIGATNCLVFKDEKIIGYNTDWFGFYQNLQQKVKINPFAPALIIGAGGAAKGVLYALQKMNLLEIIIVNRTADKASILKTQAYRTDTKTKIICESWENLPYLIKNCGLLINTTSLGMIGQKELALNNIILSKQTIVSDIVYTPLQTSLIRMAQQQGNQAVTGIGMLLWQAVPAFEKWFKITPEVNSSLEQFILL